MGTPMRMNALIARKVESPYVADELDKIAISAHVDLVAIVRAGGEMPNVPIYDKSGIRNYDDDHQAYKL